MRTIATDHFAPAVSELFRGFQRNFEAPVGAASIPARAYNENIRHRKNPQPRNIESSPLGHRGGHDGIAGATSVPRASGPSTIHGTGIQTAFIASGNFTTAARLPAGETDTSRFHLTDVEVLAGGRARVIVTVGDSITDGVGSTEDANSRWPDALATRLQADPALASIATCWKSPE